MRPVFILLMFVQHYLLMGPIQDAIVSGDYVGFGGVCAETVLMNMEEPVKLRGNYKKERFIKELSERMTGFKVISLEWISKHIWEDYAVQSLNLKMKDERNGRTEFYKLIFFMNKEGKEWKLYYLRGIKL